METQNNKTTGIVEKCVSVGASVKDRALVLRQTPPFSLISRKHHTKCHSPGNAQIIINILAQQAMED